MFKKDYRRVDGGPSRGRVEAQNRIRDALIKCEKRFSELLVETGLSRPALWSNLVELGQKGEVESRADSDDLRVKYYFLTEKGVNAYKRQKDLEHLSLSKYFPCSVGKFIQSIGALFRDFMLVYGHAVDHEYPGDMIPRLKEESQDVLAKCVTFSFYFEEDLGEGENPYQVFRQTLKEYAQVAASVASSHDVDVERLKQLRNLLFVFKLDKERLINECQRSSK
jgi:DNA-binding MarR family transcriptional regulator